MTRTAARMIMKPPTQPDTMVIILVPLDWGDAVFEGAAGLG